MRTAPLWMTAAVVVNGVAALPMWRRDFFQRSLASTAGAAAITPRPEAPRPDSATRVKIWFHDAVTPESCTRLVARLEYEEKKASIPSAANPTPVIELHIQSNGGDLLPALFVHDYVRASALEIHTYVDGYAASAATLIALAGKRRFMYPHSTFLVHQIRSTMQGRLSELEEEAANVHLFHREVLDIYAHATGLSDRDLVARMVKERWMPADECLRLGFVDEIVATSS